MVSLDPGRERAIVRLAGHPPPLLLSADGVEALAPGPPGPPLGVLEHAAWPAYEVALPPEWSLLLFTDGLTDGRVGDGARRLGEEGLAGVVGAARRTAAERPAASSCASSSTAPRTSTAARCSTTPRSC